jgi:hypothetical protein
VSAPLRVVAHAAWAASCLGERAAFRRACRDVEGTQSRLLAATLSRNAATDYGRRFGFATIHDPATYRERLPVVRYDDLREEVERIARGEQHVLTADPVLLMEPSSGSAGASKLVPYTATLKRQFRRAVDAWIADLFASDPALWSGQSYWSISPAVARNERTPGGIPVGFEDDAEYLGAAQRALLRRVLAVPPDVRRIADAEAFRYTTLLHLARSRALALVSVWNPTFLTILLDALPGALGRIAADLEPFDPRRAAEVAAVEREGMDVAGVARALWPRLRLVSSWAHANAEPYARELADLVPHARLQPKGLLATEAAVSIPLWRTREPALAVRSHYFEFLPDGVEDGAAAVGAHEVEVGRSYSVVVTTGGGLYRYRLGDRVEVVGRDGACPLVRFAGRDDLVSDFFGEKVSEPHTATAVADALAAGGLSPRFAVVSCERDGERRAYTLWIEDAGAGAASLDRAAEALESHLLENFHYAWCRRLGQLERARVRRTVPGAARALLDECAARGQRLGDVKPSALYVRGDLAGALAGGGEGGEEVEARGERGVLGQDRRGAEAHPV